MQDRFLIHCSLEPQGQPLGLEIWINDSKLFDQESLTSAQDVALAWPDQDDQICTLKFVLKNKQDSHTVIDSTNRIVSDSLIEINNVKLDEVCVDKIMHTRAQYQHNFNGNGQETTQKFYGAMGCNGTVSLQFTTPIYIWLLENI